LLFLFVVTFYYSIPLFTCGVVFINTGFDLSALTAKFRGCDKEPPFVHVAVGTNFGFDVDLLPPNVIQTTFKRCPENLRSGIF